jgi:DNA-binding CsgD family transcriptional regulator
MLESGTTTSPRFVGRERELDRLQRRLELARGGSGGIVAVSSEPGLGKSRLCAELAEAARQAGFAVLTGHCLDGGGGLPYLPFAEIVECAAASFGAADLRIMAGASAGPLALIAPGLRDALGDAASPPQTGSQDRHALFAALRDVLDRASRMVPLLLVIEDADWADEATMLLLRHLVRVVASRRILLVITCGRPERNDQGVSPMSQLLADIERRDAGGVITLSELGIDDVTAMIAAAVGREPPAYICEAMYRRTGGNPLFVEQVLRYLVEEGRLFDERSRWIELSSFDVLPIPASVRTVIARRIARAGADCRQLLDVAAVAGPRTEYDLVAEVAALAPEHLLAAVESAQRAQLAAVEHAEGRLTFTFRHELIRQAILEELSLPRRQRLHLAFARAIEQRGGPDGEYAIELAHHELRAGLGVELRSVMRHVEAAASRALAVTAFEDAARLYEELSARIPTSDLSARCETLLRLGEARKRVSDSDPARNAFAEAACIARTMGDAGQLARAALGYARSWPTVGSIDEMAVELLDEALARVAADDLDLRARLMSRHALQTLYAGEPKAALGRARDAVAMARRSSDLVTLARALQVLHAALWQSAHLHERLAAADEIVRLAEAIGDPSVALWGIRPRIADLMELADLPAAVADIEAYDRGAAAARQPIYLWQAAVRNAMLAIFRGQLDEGERLATRALELGRQAEGQNLMAAFGGQLLVVRWQQGRAEELRSLIEASRRNQPRVPLWAAVLSFIESEAGRPSEARAPFEELAADRFASVSREDSGLVVLVLASLVCASLGDGLRAEQLYELLLPYDGRNIVVNEGVACVGAAALYLGMLAATARRLDDAERHLREAIELSARTGGRPWLARSQYEFARVLLTRRRPGDRKSAGDLLRSALGIARDAGLRGLQERIDRITRSHRRLTDGRPDGLTRRERDVLRLVARGRSTKEISDELVLSPRTTARHITNIYAKIGARNRAEATAYALSIDLGD